MLREQLLLRQSALSELIVLAEVNADEEALAGNDHDVVDLKEQASRVEQQTVAHGRQELERSELQAIQVALCRIDQGGYGHCADCAGPIPMKRLLAQPDCLRCTACQARFEAQQRLGTRHLSS